MDCSAVPCCSKLVDRQRDDQYILVHRGTTGVTMTYIASKSLTKDRPGFSISFRHPCRVDSRGKLGLKVRRGLGTADAGEADALVAQMNKLLADESWWNASRYHDAMQAFSPVIVDAFFDGLQASVANPVALRDSIIPMPGRAEGYARVLFVGTTGAGKTSLLRHLIGSHPDRDRFPSTSTAKTTVSDIEVIPDDGQYRAAVTFFPSTPYGPTLKIVRLQPAPRCGMRWAMKRSLTGCCITPTSGSV